MKSRIKQEMRQAFALVKAKLSQKSVNTKMLEQLEAKFVETQKHLAQLQVETVLQRKKINELQNGTAKQSRNIHPLPNAEQPIQGDFDEFFVAIGERFRGSFDAIKELMRVYLPFAERAVQNSSDSGDALFLDLACGRGEWLELLKERGLTARGIETNRFLVEFCAERGLDVLQVEAVSYLRTLPDNSCVGLTAMHLIEHLPFEVLMDFLEECRRVLRPGGVLIFETPNPQNLRVGGHLFYLDPTHRNPIPPLLAQFMVEYAGFAGVEILPLHVPESERLPEFNQITANLNYNFYGAMDYAVIGWKPKEISEKE